MAKITRTFDTTMVDGTIINVNGDETPFSIMLKGCVKDVKLHTELGKSLKDIMVDKMKDSFIQPQSIVYFTKTYAMDVEEFIKNAEIIEEGKE